MITFRAIPFLVALTLPLGLSLAAQELEQAPVVITVRPAEAAADVTLR